MTRSQSKKHQSKLKRAHPDPVEDKIISLIGDKCGYCTSQIDLIEDLNVRFSVSSPPPFAHNSVAYYCRDFSFKDNMVHLLTKHNIVSSLDFMKLDDMGRPGGFSLFVQTIRWYDLREFVDDEGMLDVDTALLGNQRVLFGRLRAIDGTSSTLENTHESVGLEDSSIVGL